MNYDEWNAEFERWLGTEFKARTDTASVLWRRLQHARGCSPREAAITALELPELTDREIENMQRELDGLHDAE